MPYTILAAIPLLVILYLTYKHHHLRQTVHCRTTPFLHDPTLPLPPSVQQNPSSYTVHHETARKTVPAAALGPTPPPPSSLLTPFLRATMTTFSRYPPAWALWYLTKSASDRCTFDAAYISALDFAPGERVCGVYVVVAREEGRVVLALRPSGSYVGAVVQGNLVVEIKAEGDEIAFVNHTVMWRRKGEGSAGVLESAGGRWMHGFMVRGLVESGVTRVLEGVAGRKVG